MYEAALFRAPAHLITPRRPRTHFVFSTRKLSCILHTTFAMHAWSDSPPSWFASQPMPASSASMTTGTDTNTVLCVTPPGDNPQTGPCVFSSRFLTSIIVSPPSGHPGLCKKLNTRAEGTQSTYVPRLGILVSLRAWEAATTEQTA